MHDGKVRNGNETAALRVFQLAFVVMAVTNQTLELYGRNLVWSQISNMPTYYMRYFFQVKINKYGDWAKFKDVKVKESRKRAGVAQRVPGRLGSQISWHSARDGGEVVSLTHRPPLPPGMFLVLIFTRDWVEPRTVVRSEGNVSLKNPVTSPGIDPRTVRLVAKSLNHYAPKFEDVSDQTELIHNLRWISYVFHKIQNRVRFYYFLNQ